jgi:hypothetical protein
MVDDRHFRDCGVVKDVFGSSRILTELAKPFQRSIMLLVCPCEVREPGEIVETESFNGNYLSERCCRG